MLLDLLQVGDVVDHRYLDLVSHFPCFDPLVQLGSEVVGVFVLYLYLYKGMLALQETVKDRVVLAAFSVLSRGLLLNRLQIELDFTQVIITSFSEVSFSLLNLFIQLDFDSIIALFPLNVFKVENISCQPCTGFRQGNYDNMITKFEH